MNFINDLIAAVWGAVTSYRESVEKRKLVALLWRALEKDSEMITCLEVAIARPVSAETLSWLAGRIYPDEWGAAVEKAAQCVESNPDLSRALLEGVFGLVTLRAGESAHCLEEMDPRGVQKVSAAYRQRMSDFTRAFMSAPRRGDVDGGGE